MSKVNKVERSVALIMFDRLIIMIITAIIFIILFYLYLRLSSWMIIQYNTPFALGTTYGFENRGYYIENNEVVNFKTVDMMRTKEDKAELEKEIRNYNILKGLWWAVPPDIMIEAYDDVIAHKILRWQLNL